MKALDKVWSKMRIACVLVHNLAVQVAIAANPSLVGRPLVIGGLPFESKPVYDASPEAIASGVRIGMPLREAHAACPGAEFLPAEESRYMWVFGKVADILEKFSAVVDVERLDCAYIDISGVQDEASLCREILRQIHADTGLSACLGVSNGKFFSHIAAFTGKDETPVIVVPGQEKDFVAPFSVDTLPCSEESKERLRLLGIRFIGELARFSKEALVAQFGSEGVLMHALACGIDPSPLVPRQKTETASESVRLDFPAVTVKEILHTCEAVLHRLVPGLSNQAKLCREVTIKLSFASGLSEERKLPLKEPTHSIKSILLRLRTWLEAVKFPSEVVEVELSLALTKEQGKKLSLLPNRNQRDDGVLKAAEELELKFGYQPIKKSREVSPRPILPERRFTLSDVLE
ncbi:MAG: hypothetical protein N3E40_01840 [Dehalococcoidia bacterium]|nr:hypothetical protein [Dehalococcoidia bacterium]